MSDNSTTPAGWYPDTRPGAPAGAEMYWDGTAWRTDMVRTATAPVAAATATTSTTTPMVAEEPAAKRPWYKRKGIVIPVAIVGGIIVLSGIINAATGGGADDKSSWADGNSTQSTEKDKPVAQKPVDNRPEVPAVTGKTVADARAALEAAGFVLVVSNGAPDNAIVDSQDVAAGEKRDTGATVTVAASVPMTVAQESAVRSAQSYLDFKGFSRAGLIQQLTSEYGEGFDPADAEFAVATLEQTGQVDWNAEAVQAAQSYLDFKGFSHDGLFEQLTSAYGEQFTADQANYALAQVGL